MNPPGPLTTMLWANHPTGGSAAAQVGSIVLAASLDLGWSWRTAFLGVISTRPGPSRVSVRARAAPMRR